MKWIMLIIVLGLWSGYWIGENRRSASRTVHFAIHLLYFLLALAVIVWL